MSNPINVQAQRVLNLMTEMKGSFSRTLKPQKIEKLEILTWITPEFLGHVSKQKEQLCKIFLVFLFELKQSETKIS